MTQEPVLRLIAAIYDAVGNPARWSATIDRLREQLRSAGADDGTPDLAAIIEPHIDRAAKLHQRIVATVPQHVSGDFLDRFSVGLILLDSRCRFLWANRVASRILARGDGLKVAGNRLHAESRLLQPRLRAVLQQACKALASEPSTQDGSLVIPRVQGARPYQVLVTGVRRGEKPSTPQQPTIAVLLTDPECARRPPERLLREFFALTPTEARVAAALTGGQTTREISSQFGVSEESIRWHLKRIFAKTGVSSQAQLVALSLTTFSFLDDFPSAGSTESRRVRSRRPRTGL